MEIMGKTKEKQKFINYFSKVIAKLGIILYNYYKSRMEV